MTEREKVLEEALREIQSNVQLWAKVDNMAGRLYGIAKQALETKATVDAF